MTAGSAATCGTAWPDVARSVCAATQPVATAAMVIHLGIVRNITPTPCWAIFTTACVGRGPATRLSAAQILRLQNGIWLLRFGCGGRDGRGLRQIRGRAVARDLV